MGRSIKFALFIGALILVGPGWCDSVGAQAQTTTAPVLRGIYAFGGGKRFVDTKALDLPYVSGMTPFFKWADLEKEDGVYDFRDIDHLIGIAKPKGKTINLMFSAGMHAPEWLYRKGAKSHSWETYFTEDQWKREGKSKALTTPVPWDPVFLEHWKRFISKVAEKYGSEPTIGYISITGPVQRGLTTTMPLKKDADMDRLRDIGYSDEKVLNAWMDMIEHYHKVLGNKRLLLALAQDRRGKPSIQRAKALVKYVTQKKYTNIMFFVVFLNDTWFPRSGTAGTIRDLLKQAKAEGYSFGYQLAEAAGRTANFKRDVANVKSLKDALAIGISDGASWIEVWHDDIVDPRGKDAGLPNAKYVTDLKWAQDALLGNAPK